MAVVRRMGRKYKSLEAERPLQELHLSEKRDRLGAMDRKVKGTRDIFQVINHL